MVIFTVNQNKPANELLDLDTVDDKLNVVAKDILNFSPQVISDLQIELNDLIAIYGPDANAQAIWERSEPEKSMYLQTKDTAMPVTHFVNPGDKEFTQHAYSIELPAGNFSVAYGVYADNESDALDELADHEVKRLKHNPDIAIFKVNEGDYTTEELLNGEDSGEFHRLGNNSELFDVSNIAVTRASLLVLDASVDIGEYLEDKKRLFKDSKPTGSDLSI
jgi:hypothetical protein